MYKIQYSFYTVDGQVLQRVKTIKAPTVGNAIAYLLDVAMMNDIEIISYKVL